MSVNFESKHIDRIPTLWTKPENMEKQLPLAIWLDSFTGQKERVKPRLEELANAGFLALSFDAIDHGERAHEGTEEAVARLAENFRYHFWPLLGQTILDTTRVIDWAFANLKISSQIFVGGVSMGGDVAVAAAGFDKRIQCVASIIATPDWLRPGMKDYLNPEQDFYPGKSDTCSSFFYKSFNPLTHLESYSHQPAILFECGAKDFLVPPDGAARFQKELVDNHGYDSERIKVNIHENIGHDPNVSEMWKSCLDWFVRHK